MSRRARRSGEGCAGPGQRPKTREQWQEAVNGASALLHLDAAQQYGLVTGGPVVNAARCRAVLSDGAALCIRPREAGVNDLIKALAE